MTTRQFFTWSAWAVAITLGFPILLILVSGPGAVQPRVVIIQEGDFPDSFSVTSESMPWQIYPGIPQTSKISYYRIIVNRNAPAQDQQWGHVVVVRYSEPDTLNRAYEAIRREAEFDRSAQPLDFGERGSQTPPTYAINGSDVLFQQCGTIVHVALEDNTLNQLVSYARRLHERIVSVACKG